MRVRKPWRYDSGLVETVVVEVKVDARGEVRWRQTVLPISAGQFAPPRALRKRIRVGDRITMRLSMECVPRLPESIRLGKRRGKAKP